MIVLLRRLFTTGNMLMLMLILMVMIMMMMLMKMMTMMKMLTHTHALNPLHACHVNVIAVVVGALSTFMLRHRRRRRRSSNMCMHVFVDVDE